MIDEASLERARAAVRPLAEDLDVPSRLEPVAPHRWDGGLAHVPALHLEDVSGIPFVSVVPGVEEYQHRARVRAADGDLFAAVTPPSRGFEDYCRDRLGLGSPEFVLAEPGEHGFAVAGSCHSGAAFDRIVARAREAGGMVIHPYMAIETVWELARLVSEAAHVPVQVLGPPPPVLWIANDKSLLSEVVRRVLSESWLVETHASNDPTAMAEHLLKLAERHATGGLKRTRCASAMGNAVYDLGVIAKMRPEEIVFEVRRFLERTEWAMDEEVLVVAWEQTSDSPSTQLWIPPRGTGRPVVEGVYEQLLEGEEKIFLGSRPSRLPRRINEMLIEASIPVAAALQEMGYVGRCSFDFILIEDGADRVRAKFTECNGRWGGTSTPMRLLDRLGRVPRPPYLAQDFMHRDLIGVGFPEILDRVGDALYDPATGQGHYVFYNVGPLARTGKLDVIAIGRTADEAEILMAEDLPVRLGLAPER